MSIYTGSYRKKANYKLYLNTFIELHDRVPYFQILWQQSMKTLFQKLLTSF